jgi:hypothetical protein
MHRFPLSVLTSLITSYIKLSSPQALVKFTIMYKYCGESVDNFVDKVLDSQCVP